MTLSLASNTLIHEILALLPLSSQFFLELTSLHHAPSIIHPSLPDHSRSTLPDSPLSLEEEENPTSQFPCYTADRTTTEKQQVHPVSAAVTRGRILPGRGPPSSILA